MWPRCLNLVWNKALGTRINQSEILPDSGFLTCASGLENKRFMPSFLDRKTVGFFFSKSVKKSVKRGVRDLRPQGVWGEKKKTIYSVSPSLSRSVFSLVPDFLFDCSHVFEQAKIRTVLQSKEQFIIFRIIAPYSADYNKLYWKTILGPKYSTIHHE